MPHLLSAFVTAYLVAGAVHYFKMIWLALIVARGKKDPRLGVVIKAGLIRPALGSYAITILLWPFGQWAVLPLLEPFVFAIVLALALGAHPALVVTLAYLVGGLARYGALIWSASSVRGVDGGATWRNMLTAPEALRLTLDWPAAPWAMLTRWSEVIESGYAGRIIIPALAGPLGAGATLAIGLRG